MRSETNSLTFGDQCLYSHLLVSSGSSQSQIIETYANEAVSTATDIQNAIIMKLSFTMCSQQIEDITVAFSVHYRKYQ